MASFGKALHHVIGLIAALALTLIILYASRFWTWKGPWADDGLFGLKLFSPWGSVVQWWLNGTPFSEFNIIIWGCGSIIALSLIQWLVSRVVK